MKNIQKALQNETFSRDSIPGIAVNTYKKLWNKETFYAKELNGQPTLEFLPTTSAEFLEQQFYIEIGRAHV